MIRPGLFGPLALVAVAAVAALQPAPAGAQSCDRACLGDIMTRFLESLVAHDPAKAPLADDVRFTEDTKDTPIGGGFWATASKLGAFRTDFLDVREQTAAVHAVMEENGTPVLFAARLKVENREITEIETMVVRGRAEAMLFDLTRLDKPSVAFTTMPPRDQLNSREEMIDIAMRYPGGLRVGSFVTSDVPFAADAYRLENGQLMAGPDCTFIPGCNDIRNQTLPTLAGITGEVVAVDEENGTVLTRLDFGPGSLMGGGGRGGRGGAPGAAPGAGAAAGGAPAPQMVLVTFEAFKIYGGQVHAVEAVFESMPQNTPRGWE
jgi:hypothetical protein